MCIATPLTGDVQPSVRKISTDQQVYRSRRTAMISHRVSGVPVFHPGAADPRWNRGGDGMDVAMAGPSIKPAPVLGQPGGDAAGSWAVVVDDLAADADAPLRRADEELRQP